MNLKLKLYIKHFYNTIKGWFKYFAIWLATGTWLPFLAWKFMFIDDLRRNQGVVMIILDGVLSIVLSAASVMICYGVYFLMESIIEEVRDYFKKLSYKIESEIYSNNKTTKMAKLVNGHMEDVVPTSNTTATPNRRRNEFRSDEMRRLRSGLLELTRRDMRNRKKAKKTKPPVVKTLVEQELPRRNRLENID